MESLKERLVNAMWTNVARNADRSIVEVSFWHRWRNVKNSIFDWIARKNKVIEVKLSIKTCQEQARDSISE